MGHCKKLTLGEIEQRIKNIHEKKVSIDLSTYQNMHKKTRFIDKDFGEWWTRPQSVIYQKTGHPDRGVLKIKKRFTKKIAEVKKMLQIAHGEMVVLDESTYINLQKKCRFIDKDLGEWWALPHNVIHKKHGHPNKKNQKRKERWIKKYGVDHYSKTKRFKRQLKQTSLKKYGVEHPMQNKEVSLKVAKKSQYAKVLRHWKTQEEIVCVGSYEYAVVSFWNKNEIDYQWQIPFKMPNGKVYIIDAFLPKRNLYVEIKGYMRDHSKKKWEWFHNRYSNSELWNKPKLKEMKLI